MSQTVNGQDTSEQKPQKDSSPAVQQKPAKDGRPAAVGRSRPGQRQQERMQRLARRRKRQRIISASVIAVLVVVLGVAGTISYQDYTAQQAASYAEATGTAGTRLHASETVIANETATVVSQDCFVSPNGVAVPAIYASNTKPTAGPTTAPALKGTPVTLSGGLKYIDIKVGTGPALQDGKTINANYTGWLASTCQKFDSSYDAHGSSPPAPMSIQLTQGSLIQGWVEGAVGMKAGGIRRIYIPSALGYGSQATGPIPANANLIFDIQLISFK